ncbi:amylo-alpha-1,6-glucosidase [Flammeovirgaceae bacterium SG7u.111]|nr:amylo-alpha-1,6-glucosidase [Flammeovirgaceae bacterium SG7u.132]WPO37383.1 amylo-alpha-1,6-glucosidase [Flammeovirgaceae bacterium SG7u.111]
MKSYELAENSLAELTEKEWIVTNGLGGYASSTLCHMNTRKYHGLLVASHFAPVNRHVHISKIDETVVTNFGSESKLANNQFPGLVSPEGYKFIKTFERDPMPSFVYEGEGFRLQKTVFMVNRSNTTVVEYQNIYEHGFHLRLAPLFVEKDFHHLFSKSEAFNYHMEDMGNEYEIYPCYGASPIHLSFSTGEFKEKRFWLDNIEYLADMKMGQAFREGLFHLGENSCYLNPGEKVYVVMSLDKALMGQSPEELKNRELDRLAFVGSNLPEGSFARDLAKSADQFFAYRESTHSETIMAGFPWVTDRARDTLIAMRGMTIAAGHYERSKQLIRSLAQQVRRGLLPHKFADYKGHEFHYDAVDTSLWLFQVLYEFDQKFDDTDFLKEMYDSLVDILNWYIKGTDYNIHLTEEGFIYAGFINTHVTWMDAQTDEFVVTPRNGCPVEVNLLWYNALEVLEYVGGRTNKIGFQFRYLKELFKENFKSYFWNRKGYLNDLVRPGATPDNRIRPNQIIALSLPFSLLTEAEEKKVLKAMDNELWTPYGLRTVSVKDPGFQPNYEGDRWARDKAYHQGTVWPFLLMDYYLAYLKVYKNSVRARKKVAKDLAQLKHHFYEENCLYGVSEIFDGLAPEKGKGLPNQAVAIGALLKILLDFDLKV